MNYFPHLCRYNSTKHCHCLSLISASFFAGGIHQTYYTFVNHIGGLNKTVCLSDIQYVDSHNKIRHERIASMNTHKIRVKMKNKNAKKRNCESLKDLDLLLTKN